MPWHADRVFAVRAGLPNRFRAMVDVAGGCGQRQGEVFALAEDAVNFDTQTLHIVQQVKIVRGQLVFAPPKCNKLRDVPLPNTVAEALKLHMEAYPPVVVTLPWQTPDGPPATRRLLFTIPAGQAVRRTDFNQHAWKPALVAAGVIPERGRGRATKRPASTACTLCDTSTPRSCWTLGRTSRPSANTWAMPTRGSRCGSTRT